MDADYGGTEIASALRSVYQSCKSTPKPSNVFLLTDGEAWDVDTCVSHAEGAASQVPHYVRTFVIGLGSGVSTNMCDSIARAGDAVAIYVAENEPFTGKIGRLVRAARSPPVRDVKVRWGEAEPKDNSEDFELVDAPVAQSVKSESVPATVNLFDSMDVDDDNADDSGPPPAPKVDPLPTATIQQAPQRPAGIFPGTRSQYFAISSAPVPTSVKVTGKVVTSGETVEIEVPVSQMLPHSEGSASTPPSAPLLHVLAAKALITDLESGRHDFPATLSKRFKTEPQLQQAHLDAEIVRLGVEYQLTSKCTSFIAVDEEGPRQPRPAPPVMPVARDFGGGGVFMRARAAAPMACMAPPPPPGGAMPQMSVAPAPAPKTRAFGGGLFGVKAKAASFGQAPAAAAYGGASAFLGAPGSAPAWSQSENFSVSEEAAPASVTTALLQAFDGHFELDSKLIPALNLDKTKLDRVVRDHPEVKSNVLATVLAILWFEKRASEDDGTEDLKEKAADWVDLELGGDAGRLEEIKSWLGGVFVAP